MKQVVPILALSVLLSVTGCSSGGDGNEDTGGNITDSTIAAAFSQSGTPSRPDLVRLTGTPADDMVTISVAIAGQTTSTDLFSFAFDLVLSEGTVVELIDTSVDFGTALTLSGGQTGEALATKNGDRITVGVSKLGGGAGNGVGTTEEAIVSMTLRVRKRSTTTIRISGSPPNDPAALDSTGAVINGVIFDDVVASIAGT